MNEKLRSVAKKVYAHTPLCVFFIVFVLFAYIAWCSPLVSDDLQFAGYGFTTLRELAHFSLNYGNGRLLGNLLSGILSNNRVLYSLVSGFCTAVIAVMIPKAAGAENNVSYLLSALFLILCSSEMFSQVYTWTCGFSNYVPPVAIALTVVYLVLNYNKVSTPPQKKIGIRKIFAVLCCVIAGFSMQLFSEHGTVLFLLLSIAFVVYAFIKKDGRRILSIALMFSALAGAVTMFLIPRFFGNESQTQEYYREILIGNIPLLTKNFLNIGRTLTSSWFAVISLTVIVLVVFYNNRSKVSKNVYSVLSFLLLLFGTLAVLGQLLFRQDFYGIWITLFWMLFAGCMVCYFAVLITILFLCGKNVFNVRIATCICSVVLVIGMLTCVKPFSDRCLFLPYVLIVILTINLFDKNVCSAKSASGFSKIMALSSSVSLVILCGLFVAMFSEIKLFTAAQDKYIAEQMTQTSEAIEIFEIPYTYAKDGEGLWARERYYYHKEWGDVEFTMVEWDEWMNKHGDYFSIRDIFYNYTPIEHKK